jgi:hypothetical protein
VETGWSKNPPFPLRFPINLISILSNSPEGTALKHSGSHVVRPWMDGSSPRICICFAHHVTRDGIIAVVRRAPLVQGNASWNGGSRCCALEFGEQSFVVDTSGDSRNREMWVRTTCAMSPALGPSLGSFLAEVGG